MRKCVVGNPNKAWEEVMEWGVTLCKLAFETVVYHIWKQRNDIRHDNVLKIEEQILKGMHWEIRSQSDGCGENQEVIRK